VIGDQTLLDGLGMQGGSTVGGGVEILMRAAIAGLLNAASPNVNYPLSQAQIISQVNAAIATGDRDTIGPGWHARRFQQRAARRKIEFRPRRS
jgi:hypothetical protein